MMQLSLNKTSKKMKLSKSIFLKTVGVRERLEQGKAIRLTTPRSSLAEFKIQRRRQSPIDILRLQEKSRIQEYVPIRHARMAVNPFAFFRGGAAFMAHDLSKLATAPINVQLCGDMHVSNFGFFSTTERQLVFGINDFDETLPGNFDWDLKRLTASAMIAAEHLGQDREYGESIVRLMVTAYREHMLTYAHMPYIELARAYIDDKALLSKSNNVTALSKLFIEKQIIKARKNTNHGVIAKLTEATPTGRKIIDQPPLLEHIVLTRRGNKVTELLDDFFNTYVQSLLPDRKHLLMRYRVIDYARKVVGVGSVGTACWVLYMEGLNENDPLFLQTKEAQRSVLAPYFSDAQFRSHGARVVHGQRLIQGAPDLFLGYGKTRELDFYIRQLRDMKGGISIDEDGVGVHEFPDYAKLFGWALANAHARSGDPALLAGYCGRGEQLDDALVQFSTAYCEQNRIDYETFMRAIKSGKISCATENF